MDEKVMINISSDGLTILTMRIYDELKNNQMLNRDINQNVVKRSIKKIITDELRNKVWNN